MDQEQYDLTGVNWFPESIEELPDWARPRDKVERELERIHKQARPYLETPRGLLLFWSRERCIEVPPDALGPIRSYWKERRDLKRQLAFMEQEAQQNLARLVPEELEVWETNTKAIWELITTGASCTQYCFCADCLAEGIKELYGFASPAECVEKLKLLASAWEGQVIVSTDWSGPGSERVDVVFQVL